MSVYAIDRANKTSSAATLVTLSDGFRQAWQRFLKAPDVDAQKFEFADLMNLYEIACAIYLEGSLTGNSGKLIYQYLQDELNRLKDNEYAEQHIPPLLTSADTFRFIRQFLSVKQGRLSITSPPQWYQRSK